MNNRRLKITLFLGGFSIVLPIVALGLIPAYIETQAAKYILYLLIFIALITIAAIIYYKINCSRS